MYEHNALGYWSGLALRLTKLSCDSSYFFYHFEQVSQEYIFYWLPVVKMIWLSSGILFLMSEQQVRYVFLYNSAKLFSIDAMLDAGLFYFMSMLVLDGIFPLVFS